jgi:diaminohydroxyphosphoribosylaminopyrimidine deaminase / 5-amino-6-(5-phosphoribosylamino)uracil reductase
VRDAAWLLRCVELARRGEGRTAPNPPVGCVIVAEDGRVLAEGWHMGPGTLHAEAAALDELGGRAEGATIYTSLEPCAHESPRKAAPCADLCARSGARRVVFGLRDPVPGHGGGAEKLRAAGLSVDGPHPGTEEACRQVIAPFLSVQERGRAFVTLKAAASLDGRIATRTGESQWITGEAARMDVHRLRDRVDAILVGAGTVLTDDPRLTTRGVGGEPHNPVRVVLDGKLRVGAGMKMLREPGRTVIVTGSDDNVEGAEMWRAPSDPVDLEWLVAELGRAGLHSVLVEGGGVTLSAFLERGLCDRLVLYLAPRVIGGPRGWIGGEGWATLAEAPGFRIDGDPIRLGEDLRVVLTPRRN